MSQTIESILDLPNSKDVLVLRTDFSSDFKWSRVCELISQSGKELGFKTYVEFISDKKFDGLQKERLLNRSENYEHLFIFMVDNLTLNHVDNPILCVDLYDKPGQFFRVIPSAMWGVENNLSISNIDFDEFKYSTDEQGIFRGY